MLAASLDPLGVAGVFNWFPFSSCGVCLGTWTEDRACLSVRPGPSLRAGSCRVCSHVSWLQAPGWAACWVLIHYWQDQGGALYILLHSGQLSALPHESFRAK